MLSAVMEDYIKTIFHLQSEVDGQVRTSAIADRLDVTPPTVTSMLEKLENRGFIEREKYAGVELTPEGEQVALEVIRHHRLLETYLSEHLDYTWSEVHDEADRLEHHISEDFEARLADVLDDPRIDPHGDPIPSADLEPIEDEQGRSLGNVEEGDVVVVTRVSDREPDVLDYLAERGVGPGARLEITEIAPFGMVTIVHGEVQLSLPERIAHRVHVEPFSNENATRVAKEG